jgi:hypothetical protein
MDASEAMNSELGVEGIEPLRRPTARMAPMDLCSARIPTVPSKAHVQSRRPKKPQIL